MARAVVGERMADARPLTARLQSRSDADLPWETLAVGGATQLVWDHRPVPLQSFRMPDAGPNAPLLKRVVRHPYGMEPDRPIRSQVFDASRPDRAVERGPSVQMVFRSSRDARNLPAPLPLDHAPGFRSHPFVRARRAGEEDR